MHQSLIDRLACPACHGSLAIVKAREADGEIESGALGCSSCSAEYPIVRFVPRFVPPANYAGNFGFQWNRFRRTQLDSNTGTSISRSRFFSQSTWRPEAMVNRWTLDVGCGAGRFAEVALGVGARLVAVDYSSAVDACRDNLAPHPRLDVVQADVYRLPFRPATFDFVYCFGVLQHTPDVHTALLALARQVGDGGRLAVDVYPRLALNAVWPKYWLRPVTRRLPPERLFPIVERMVAWLWPLSVALGRVPRLGRRLRHALPVANYEGILPLSPAQLREWAVLDTFDMLAPMHDSPQTERTIRTWLHETTLSNIEVHRQGLVIGRARRAVPAA